MGQAGRNDTHAERLPVPLELPGRRWQRCDPDLADRSVGQQGRARLILESVGNQPVGDFTATVSAASGTPTGSVTFKDGATTLGSTALTNGVATYTTAALTFGTHSIVVAYPGDANFGSSGSSLTQGVNVHPATVTLSALSQTYNGSPKPATCTSTPAGLTLGLTYDGSSVAPSNVGHYAVLCTISQTGYS
ncbi:Ig-like domain repeat protein, partial [bacterium]|nr:Ig-like domain repeat protein [bacterium]